MLVSKVLVMRQHERSDVFVLEKYHVLAVRFAMLAILLQVEVVNQT